MSSPAITKTTPSIMESVSSLAVQTGAPGSFLFTAVFLLMCHVFADRVGFGDATLSFFGRLRGGTSALSSPDLLYFAVVVLLVFESLDYVIKNSGIWMGSKQIPVRAKHLDTLMPIDRLFICVSKCANCPFVYLYVRYVLTEPNIKWNLSELSAANTFGAVVCMFAIYDFFFWSFHWALHMRSIYSSVHKHHHRQLAPSRGTEDAINVHPFEYFLGQYNHLLAMVLCHILVVRLHALTALGFMAVAGILGGLNHTRFDISCSFWGIPIYDSKAHDVHHRLSSCNYGQYTMLWDWLFGTFRPYDPKGRISLDAQLDPTTGKSLACTRHQQTGILISG